ncbi:MAG: hypothetical protein BWY69_00237 [Planctomycetes bacterium ADurb.Bin401]|nr:MAG: hypothetical protein BWY69_00237 [Planctomycetes bacterium ADurb.Bin401]
MKLHKLHISKRGACPSCHCKPVPCRNIRICCLAEKSPGSASRKYRRLRPYNFIRVLRIFPDYADANSRIVCNYIDCEIIFDYRYILKLPGLLNQSLRNRPAGIIAQSMCHSRMAVSALEGNRNAPACIFIEFRTPFQKFFH